jgi:hypothetical protein
MNALTLWREIMQDLLTVSPNILFSRSLNSETVQSLRAKALRFRNVDSILAKGDSSLIHSRKDIKLIESAKANTLKILPGTSYAIYVSVSASISIVNLSTGAEYDLWSIPGPPRHCTKAEMQVFSSTRYGLVALAGVSYDALYVSYHATSHEFHAYFSIRDIDTEPEHAVWFFQVVDASDPGIMPIVMLHGWDSIPDRIGFGDDTLMMVWAAGLGSPLLITLDIPLAVERANAGDDAPSVTRWLLSEDVTSFIFFPFDCYRLNWAMIVRERCS